MPHNLNFDQVTIIGLGLIGSSIARAVREYGLANHITGCDDSDTALGYARSHNIVDAVSRDPALSAGGSQLIIIATPVATFRDIARRIGPKLQPGTIVMDVGSVKRAAVEAITPLIPKHADFIPAHPIAGSEHSGIGAGRADLFQKKRVIVSPAEAVETEALKRVTKFWSGMGARVEGIPADLHDQIYGYVSHLPQLLAFAARQAVIGADGAQLKTFLRIAHSNPKLWIDIFALNHDYIVAGLDRYLDALLHIHKELLSEESPASAAPEAGLSDALFSRVAASCLITTVMEAEKKGGFSFARLAGSGFADFTSPAASEPESDLEKISNASRDVAAILKRYADTLQRWRSLLDEGKFGELQALLSPSR